MRKPPKAGRFKLTPLAAAVGAIVSPMHSHAEEQATIEEIIVTATKRESELQDVAQSISAFTEDDIARMGMDSMEDYVRALPSMYMQATKPGRNQLVMRGISTGSDQFRTDSQVAVYLDEQPMTSISQQVGPEFGGHAAHRVVAGSTRHAVWIQLADRHDSHDHQQAGL